VGGNPSYGYGTTFGTQFTVGSVNETRLVTVTDGYQTSTCTVYVYGPMPTYTWTPTPTPYSSLQCSPSYSSANSGDLVYFSAWGGNGTYAWSAGSGAPSYGYGSSFSSRFYNYNYGTQSNVVTVTSNGQSATCTVSVNGSYWTPTPTPYNYGNVSFSHSINDLTRGGSGTSITAQNGDRIQFVATITTGNGYVGDPRLRDWLPQYVTYTPGSTTLDGVRQTDDIVLGNSNTSLALMYLAPNQTYTVRFEGTLNGAPNGTLTNSINLHVQGYADQNRTSTILVTGGYYWPTPTPYYGTQTQLTTAGRNVTAGQTGERTSIRAHGGDTLDFIVHIQSINGSYLSNAYLTDMLPYGLTYIPGSTTLNGYAIGDGVTTSGINVGTVSPNSGTIVKFSVRVEPSAVPATGSVTVNNSAQLRADGLNAMSVQMPITMGQTISISGVSGVKTGPADSLWLALLLAFLVTGAYAAYTRSDLFGRRMATAEVAQLARTQGPNFVQ
jgi:uncharacterized repeat protein (TIGR01451 family)